MITLRFASHWNPLLIGVLAIAAGCLAWWLYRRELRRVDVGWTGRWLPILRGTAIGLVVLTLAQPIVERRYREGEPAELLFLLDASHSMSLTDQATESAADAPAMSRLERAARSLVDPQAGLLQPLSDGFGISVARFDQMAEEGESSQAAAELGPELLWHRSWTGGDELPSSSLAWVPEIWGSRTAVGDALQHSAAWSQSLDPQTARAVVLMSDGQSHAGASAVQVGQALQAAGVKVFTVGFGPEQEPPDLALIGVTAPDRVYRSDVLRGKLLVKDALQPGAAYRAEILHAGQVVWQQALVAEGSSSREIDFSVPMPAVVEAELQQLPRDVQYAMLPVELTARLTAATPEANSQNNHSQLVVSVASQKARLLLVDGRSRWETRYLRNLFSRDPAWDVDSVIAGPDLTDRDGERLPDTRDAWFDYNLVILGDAPAALWDKAQLEWLKQFVEQGGGLILIDGARQSLQASDYQSLQPLWPVRWKPTAGGSLLSSAWQKLPKRAELTPVGQRLEALVLTQAAPLENSDLWRRLPPLHFVSEVEPLPGSEVLLRAQGEVDSQPLLVTRRFGAGRVLYVASDETWRWRFEVADLIHQRLWNQLARWVMRVPLSAQGEFVALDTGAASVDLGEPIEVRCRLKEGSAAGGGSPAVTAVVQREGALVMRLPLVADDGVPGGYAGQLNGLPAGNYQVHIEAAGYSQTALNVTSRFTVIAPDSQEMLRTAVNTALLEQLARETGGAYLAETEVDRLVELLQPISGGRIVRSATILWQSYWWFAAALLLLLVEWILRKRVGLI